MNETWYLEETNLAAKSTSLFNVADTIQPLTRTISNNNLIEPILTT